MLLISCVRIYRLALLGRRLGAVFSVKSRSMAGLDEDRKKIKDLLISSKKLDRESGAVHLSKLLATADENTYSYAEQMILDIIAHSEVKWEPLQGGMLGARAILQSSESRKNDFGSIVMQHALRLLEYKEYAVRLSAGEVIGALCKKIDNRIFLEIRDMIFLGIKNNLEATVSACSSQSAGVSEVEISACSSQSAGVSEVEHEPSSSREQHDLTKWKYLETWMKCLQSVIESYGAEFNAHVDENLVGLIAACLDESSRFVRETACLLHGAIVATNFSPDGKNLVPIESSSVCALASQLSHILARTMADTCSQVRMAACVVARKFLVSLPEGTHRPAALVVLLPALCFNRYYAAEGVRLYSQETWNLLTEGKGKLLVEENINDVVEFYSAQLSDGNPEVKDTACVCINELSQKMNVSVLGQYVPRLITALQSTFSSDCFSTRDAACIACGKIVAAFPLESQSSMDSLYSWLFELLQDNAPPVREAASIALSSVVCAYGEEALVRIAAMIGVGLKGVEKAESSSVGSPLNATAHSACSMSESTVACLKLHKAHRSPEPWELADGCLCLMCELSRLPSASSHITKLIPSLASAASHRHYAHHVFFLQSVCKQLPVLFKCLGKRVLKMYLEMFLDVIFYAVSCDTIPVNEAARECVALLSKDLGPNIFRARVESYNSRYLEFLPPPPH